MVSSFWYSIGMQKNSYSDSLLKLTTDLLLPFVSTFRTTQVDPSTKRHENDAEHSFMLAVVACSLAPEIDKTLDIGKISQYAIAHDLVEAYAGDTPIWADADMHATKIDREYEALQKIQNSFGSTYPWIAETIQKYEEQDEPESRFVYALDKLVPYLVILGTDTQPYPHTLAVYEEKLATMRQKVESFPELLPYLEAFDVMYRKRPHFFVEKS